MRLNSFYRKAITTVFYDIFHTGSIYLFGSRVDDSAKGGDTDLYLEIDEKSTFEKKIQFLSRLKRIIGEQKIDTVFNTDAARPIEEEIRKWAVKL
jgi:predicted nucleotidyltransferase